MLDAKRQTERHFHYSSCLQEGSTSKGVERFSERPQHKPLFTGPPALVCKTLLVRESERDEGSETKEGQDEGGATQWRGGRLTKTCRLRLR